MTAANTATGEKHLELTVSNFGPIAEGRVELRPFTVFVGPSNTGKSYLATLIYALHRFFGEYPVVGALRRINPFSRFIGLDVELPESPVLSEYAAAYVYDLARKAVLHHDATGMENSSPYELPPPMAELVRSVINGLRHDGLFLDNEIVRCFGVDISESLARYTDSNRAGFSLHSKAVNEPKSGAKFSYEVGISRQKDNIAVSVPSDLPLITRLDKFDRPAEAGARMILDSVANDVLANLVDPLSLSAHYLLTSRANLMHTHPEIVKSLIAGASRTAVTPTFSGLLGDFLERIVSLGSQKNQREAVDFPLALDMEQNILGGAIRIASNPVGYPEFLYRPDGWERDLSLANTSAMVSELAPVVLYLRHIVQPGDTLIIEEPESHLHPTMQVEFTRLLAAAIKAGVRIIITTHSEWILEELANLLLMSELPEDQRHGFEAADLTLNDAELGVWSFESDAEAGGTVVKEIPFDKEMGKFPSDFGLVTASLYNRFVRIVNRIEMLKEE